VLAVFPYLKTSEPVRYRSVMLRSTDDRTALSSDESARLQEIEEMFFLRDHHRISRMSYAVPDDDNTAGMQRFQRDLHELRELLAYGYSAPHRSLGDPFLRSEHSTVYVFRAKRMFRSLVESSEDTTATQPVDYPEPDEREEIPAYECQVDGRSFTWVARGSRIYPPCVRLWLNLSQDIAYQWRSFERSAALGPVFSYFARRTVDTELHGRLRTALTWYNRSTAVDAPDDAALVHLATAFESLLGLEQEPQITKRFKEAVLLLIGKVPRADLWIDQFYKARSEIVHRGATSSLYFQPEVRADVATAGQHRGYRSLTTYGWFIFQICGAAVSSGALVAESQGLEALLLTNGQRLDRICRTLVTSDQSAEDRLSAVAQDIYDIDTYRFVPEAGLKPDRLLKTVKLAATRFLEARPSECDLAVELQSVANIKIADVLDALTRLRTLHDRANSTRWRSATPDKLRDMIASLVDSSWHYLFTLYFHLEQQAKSAGTTPTSHQE
jgi:hypothetical protein